MFDIDLFIDEAAENSARKKLSSMTNCSPLNFSDFMKRSFLTILLTKNYEGHFLARSFGALTSALCLTVVYVRTCVALFVTFVFLTVDTDLECVQGFITGTCALRLLYSEKIVLVRVQVWSITREMLNFRGDHRFPTHDGEKSEYIYSNICTYFESPL